MEKPVERGVLRVALAALGLAAFCVVVLWMAGVGDPRPTSERRNKLLVHAAGGWDPIVGAVVEIEFEGEQLFRGVTDAEGQTSYDVSWRHALPDHADEPTIRFTKAGFHPWEAGLDEVWGFPGLEPFDE